MARCEEHPPRVAIIGVGGLGTPAAAALAAAGVSLRLIDPDFVEPSNLPRQPLFGTGDIGKAKARVAAQRLGRAHPGLDIEALVDLVEEDNASDLLWGCTTLLDATDGLAAKTLLNAVAVESGVALVHAGVLGLEGQLMTIRPAETACLRCLFVELPEEDELPTCQQAGILGPVVGLIGLAAAGEALALAQGRRAPLENRLAILDARRLRWREVALRPNPACPLDCCAKVLASPPIAP